MNLYEAYMTKISVIALSLWVITVAIIGGMYIQMKSLPSSDGRVVVQLSPQERNYLLAEMRNMLISVQQLVTALADNDRSKAVLTAQSASSHGSTQGPMTLMVKLPNEFKQAGAAMHAGFRELAASIERGDASERVYSQLANQLTYCVGCHETYRVDLDKE